jgi:tetratricopeptide (TPR) repeat protein
VAEGNPFFLRELTTYWLQTGTAYQVPASLQALMEDRLAALTPRALRTLQTVTILGKHAVLDRVERVLEYKRHELVDAIEALDKSGSLTFDGQRFAAPHALLSDLATKSLGTATRTLLHRQVAMVLAEDAQDSQSSQLLWESAEHWRAGGWTEEGVNVARSSAKYLSQIGLPTIALEMLELALPFCEPHGSQIQVLREIAVLSSSLGRWSHAMSTLSLIGSVTNSSSDSSALTDEDDLLLSLEVRWHLGWDLRALANEAFALALVLSHSSTCRVRAATLALMFADEIGDRALGRQIYSEFTRSLPPTRPDLYRARLEIVYASSCAEPADAIRAADAYLAASDNLSPYQYSIALSVAASVYDCAGHRAGAISLFHALQQHAVRHGLALAFSAAISLGYSYFDDGRLEEARAWYQRALACAEQYEGRDTLLNLDWLGAVLALHDGDAGTAHRLLVAHYDLTALPYDSHIRRRLWARTLQVRIATIRGERLELTDLQDLLACFEQLEGRGLTDYCALAVADVSRDDRIGDLAIKLLRRYLSRSRAESSPPPWYLRDFTEGAPRV